MIIQNFLVVTVSDAVEDAIQYEAFEKEKDAAAYYAKKVEEGDSEIVFLCKVLEVN